MRSFIVLLIVLGVWLAYKKHSDFAPLIASVKPGKKPSKGARSTFAKGNGSATNFSRTGNSSPGTGTPAVQPQLTSSYGISGQYGPGYTGISFAKGQK